MHPVIRKRSTVAAFTLGNFVFVMRENQILTAAVNVNRFAEVASDHGGAFNVPAGSSLAPRGLPIRLAGLRILPESKVHRLFFQLPDIDSGSRFEILKRLMRKLAVFMEFFRAEIDVAVNGIGKAFFDKGRNNLNNLVNVFRSFRVIRRFPDIHALCVFPEFFDIFFGNFLKGQTLLIRTADNFIVDIGEILNKGNLVAPVLEITAKNIKHAKRSCVSDMDKVINRRTASIDFKLAGCNRNKLLLLSC